MILKGFRSLFILERNNSVLWFAFAKANSFITFKVALHTQLEI